MRCCVKSSIVSYSNNFVSAEQNLLVVLVEGIMRNICVILF